MVLRLSLVAGLLSVVILCFSTQTISAEKSIVDTVADLILAYGLDKFMDFLDHQIPGTKCLWGLKDLGPILKKMECTDYFKCKLKMDKFKFRKAIRNIINGCDKVIVRMFVLKASILASKQLKIAKFIGMAADMAQFALEQRNYTVTGKVVGAIGYTVSGGLIGFKCGGTIGIFVGGVLGFSFWATSEMKILAAQDDIAELQSMCVNLFIAMADSN